MGTGSSLESLVRRSADLLRDAGLRLEQTSPRAIHQKSLKGGKAVVRYAGKGGLDFNGHLRGRAVSFDAKSNKVATSFPLKLLKRHQVVIVKNCHTDGAIAFFLVEFSTLPAGPRYFALGWPLLKSFWSRFEGMGEPASIPLHTFEAHCIEVQRAGTVLDLVGAIQQLAARRDEEGATA